VIERHLLQQAERCSKALVDGRRRVVVQNLSRQGVVLEGGCRDRGMGIRSKLALIQARHEGGEQLTLANRPFGGAPHDGMGVFGMRPSKKARPVP
jgi:hypothetical protein